MASLQMTISSIFLSISLLLSLTSVRCDYLMAHPMGMGVGGGAMLVSDYSYDAPDVAYIGGVGGIGPMASPFGVYNSDVDNLLVPMGNAFSGMPGISMFPPSMGVPQRSINRRQRTSRLSAPTQSLGRTYRKYGKTIRLIQV